MDSLLMIKQDT